ncbi:MAG: hypothetical protein GXO15_00505 [Crenarchaeota archaeon]|nr:hypothetical protein [Thermoproteota archaeon]
MAGCLVLDASAFQADEPGPRSPCSRDDVVSSLALMPLAHKACWRICIPLEASDELHRSLSRLYSNNAVYSVIYDIIGRRERKISYVPLEGCYDRLSEEELNLLEGLRDTDRFYPLLASCIAAGLAGECRGCDRVVLVTCDDEMFAVGARLGRLAGFEVMTPRAALDELHVSR